jgi:O-antigen/teichoic acid export membrane protein
LLRDEKVDAPSCAAQGARKRWSLRGGRDVESGEVLQAPKAPRSTGHVVITIALSLFSTTIVTAGLGFVFWAVAAHVTTPEVVGRASAVISAMLLIAAFSTLGLQTLLIAELPRRDGADVKRLVVTSLGISGGLAFTIAAVYAVVNHAVAKTDDSIYATPLGVVLFGTGTAISTMAVVLDGALVGVQQSGRQASRNLVFSLVKLIALPAAAFTVGLSPQIVFSVWLLGNVVSLLILGLRNKAPREWLKTKPSLRGFAPLWRTASGYYWVNVATHGPLLAMPVMVAAQLGAQANAGFYAALLLVSVIWIIPTHLATAMLTLDGANADHFGRGLKTALRLSGLTAVVAAAGAPALARPVLAIFGTGYEQASSCLVALTFCAFPFAIKSIYIPVRRSQGALGRAALAASLGAALELGAVELGLKFGGVTGVGIALVVAMTLEALFFWPTIHKARNWSGLRAKGAERYGGGQGGSIVELALPGDLDRRSNPFSSKKLGRILVKRSA